MRVCFSFSLASLRCLRSFFCSCTPSGPSQDTEQACDLASGTAPRIWQLVRIPEWLSKTRHSGTRPQAGPFAAQLAGRRLVGAALFRVRASAAAVCTRAGLTFLVSMRGIAAGGCSSAGGSIGTGMLYVPRDRLSVEVDHLLTARGQQTLHLLTPGRQPVGQTRAKADVLQRETPARMPSFMLLPAFTWVSSSSSSQSRCLPR